MGRFALAVIAQCLDDPAVTREPAAAAPHDTAEFVAQRGQLCDLRLDLFQMRGGDAVGVGAVAIGMVGQVEQRTDFLDRETQVW